MLDDVFFPLDLRVQGPEEGGFRLLSNIISTTSTTEMVYHILNLDYILFIYIRSVITNENLVQRARSQELGATDGVERRGHNYGTCRTGTILYRPISFAGGRGLLAEW